MYLKTIVDKLPRVVNITKSRTTPADRDIGQMLTAAQAREQLSYVLEHGGFSIPSQGHVRERMEERDITVAQVVSVAEKGRIDGAGEWENGSWRYRVWRGEIGIVVMFVATDKSRVCTVLEVEIRKRRRQRNARARKKRK